MKLSHLVSRFRIQGSVPPLPTCMSVLQWCLVKPKNYLSFASRGLHRRLWYSSQVCNSHLGGVRSNTEVRPTIMSSEFGVFLQIFKDKQEYSLKIRE